MSAFDTKTILPAGTKLVFGDGEEMTVLGMTKAAITVADCDGEVQRPFALAKFAAQYGAGIVSIVLPDNADSRLIDEMAEKEASSLAADTSDRATLAQWQREIDGMRADLKERRAALKDAVERLDSMMRAYLRGEKLEPLFRSD